jgi:hypothetical protein
MAELLLKVGGKIVYSGASHDPDVISEKRRSFLKQQCHIHTAGTVQSWFKSMKVNFNISGQHNPDLKIIEPLWSVFETRVRNKFPPPTPLKPLEDILQEEWHKSSLETVQKLFPSIPRRTAAVLKARDGQTPY